MSFNSAMDKFQDFAQKSNDYLKRKIRSMPKEQLLRLASKNEGEASDYAREIAQQKGWL